VGSGTTYDVHLGLIGKRLVDFLLVLIELFFAFYGSGATSECLKSAISLQRGPVNPKFQVEGVAVAPTNHSSSQKTRLNDLSYMV